MTEIDLIIDLHKNSERQGPGSKSDTLKALHFLNLSPDKELRIVDIGCGTGGQTITLAQNTNSQITAIDLFPSFLEKLNRESQTLGLEDKISTLEKSMDDLPFEKGALDIIWSEGAVYNMGFENGIKQWRDYLKIGGYLAVSEITWITHSRPAEIENFWNREYPEIDTASRKIEILETNGYSLVGYFYLPEKSWMENYYKPMEARFENFLKRNDYSKLAKKVVEDNKAEIELYERFKEYFSYGFYLARRDN